MKILRTFLYYLYVFLFVVVLLEVAYRFQIIDFYKSELRTLNPDIGQGKKKRSILVFGDSFTVQSGSWLNQVRESLPEDFIVNSAITGTSIVETSYIAPGRIKAVDPDIVIYQLYVGNDLLGITHQLNWRAWSMTRNIYWWLSDRIRVLAYLNYKMGQVHWNFRASDSTMIDAEKSLLQEEFNKDRYREREKIYAQGDPYLINNSVLLKDNRDEDMDYTQNKLDDIISELRPDCQVYLLVIPHKAQVRDAYLSNMKDLGFLFDSQFAAGRESYPFIDRLKNHYNGDGRVVIINPLSALQTADSDSTSVYYANDEHLSERGQFVVKEIVLTSLSTNEKKN